jgi:membrane protein YqaA with SNARE-associated domain
MTQQATINYGPPGQAQGKAAWKSTLERAAANAASLPWKMILPVAATIAMSVAIGIALVRYSHVLMGLGNWGYAGVLLVETANSAAVIIPTPSMAYTLAVSQFLNPVFVGIIAGIGSSIGELVGYALGVSGRQAVEGNFLHRKFERLAQGRTGAALFAFSVLPVPFDVAGIWAGTIKYPIFRFLAFVMAGKIVKMTAVAFAGHYGIALLLNMVN